MTTATTTESAVWIGCLECYNSGQLVGDWHRAITAEGVTTDDVHGYVVPSGTHEELWVMDHEALPIRGECSPTDAQRAAEKLESVAEWQRPALLAWWASGDYTADGNGLPCVGDFEERYAGEWDSFTDYAESLFDDSGYASEVPEHLAPYFDMAAWARDLAHDYTTTDAPGSGVFIFRSL